MSRLTLIKQGLELEKGHSHHWCMAGLNVQCSTNDL